jgi:hypothetical protein
MAFLYIFEVSGYLPASFFYTLVVPGSTCMLHCGALENLLWKLKAPTTQQIKHKLCIYIEGICSLKMWRLIFWHYLISIYFGNYYYSVIYLMLYKKNYMSINYA